MGFISVNFTMLEQAAVDMELLLAEVTGVYDNTRKTSCELDNMSFGKSDIQDDLKYYTRQLADVIEDMERQIMKLKKIISLYRECEDRIYIMQGFSLPSAEGAFGVPQQSLIEKLVNVKLMGSFSGHSIMNDDWLDELVFTDYVSQ